MNALSLVKSSNFGNVQCDFYSDDKEIWMTRKQIGEALEYADPQKAIDNLHSRHKERMANHALNEYRKSFKAKLGRKRNLTLKQDRFVLLKREHKLPAFPHKVIRDAWFSEFPELKQAYELKEEFFKIYDCQSKSEALMKYKAQKASIPDNLEVFKEIVDTVDNWKKEIFNYFDHRVTNAFVEGINSTIRYIEKQRRGYGFDVLRAKIMYCD